MATAHEFTAVYQQSLPSVWHFVSARVPGYDEAQDVTSEVFTRAWKSWPRYDPSRGSPGAWLCGIAQRTVADWWRQRRPGGFERETQSGEIGESFPRGEPLMADMGPAPDRALVQEELAEELRRALATLNEREQDALALRFGAELRVAEVAQILELSAGATKMMVCRALMKLRAVLTPDLSAAALDERTADILDEAIAGVLARRGAAIPDPLLERLVHVLAIVHQPPVPPGLPDRVQACVSCATVDVDTKGDATPGPLLSRLSLVGAPGLVKTLTVPACAVCAGGPALMGPLVAAGLWGVAVAVHYTLFVLAPLALLTLWLSFRRHRQPLGLAVASVGVLAILVHLVSHTGFLSHVIGLHNELIYPGAALLAAGALVDWRSRRRSMLSRSTWL